MIDLQKKRFSCDFAGKKVDIETSKIAEQANAAIIGTCGETSVLVTVTMGKEDKKIDYFPLTVDYEERFYAAGKIIGSRFIRREGRPSEEAVLSGRLIDRTLRPLFDHRIRRDVQVVVTILSYDDENDPDFIALFTASTALMASNIPWAGPVAGVKVCRKKSGETLINPLNSEIKENQEIILEGFVSGTADRINMIELAGNETGEENVVESFTVAHNEIKKLIDFQNQIISKIGREKTVFEFKDLSGLRQKVRQFLTGKLEEALYSKDKTEMNSKLDALKKELTAYLESENEIELGEVDGVFDEEVNDALHKNILERDSRPDGRKLDELRDLYAEVALFRRLHGSALFVRGNTQALAVATLGAPGTEQMIETMEASWKRRFMLHYNFPPFSTGEVGRMGAPGRREIGHGALAEKAFRYLIPSQDEFPYTVRVVSEILSSNGSSSMATVCAASLALMDAGVPLKKPAAGIAMGLITSPKGEFKVLTDIQGPEDHHGDMDCKVAGTKDGISAMQMDVKVEGITPEILLATLKQAKKARLEILKLIEDTLPAPRKEVSPFAPVIMVLNINPEQIGLVIGPGGKTINGIIQSTGILTIDIEEDGKVYVAGNDIEKVRQAVSIVKGMTKEFEIGEVVSGEIIKILDFGAIVDLGGGKDGMIHVSELKQGFVEKVTDVVKVGDVVTAKVIRSEEGKIGLSLKAMKQEEGKSPSSNR